MAGLGKLRRWMRRNWKDAPEALKRQGVGLLASIFFLTITHFRSEQLDRYLLHCWQWIGSAALPSEQVLIVALDDRSLQHLGFPGGRPWSRAGTAQVLEALKAHPIRGAIIDVLLAGSGLEPSDDVKLQNALSGVPTIIAERVSEIATVASDGSRHIVAPPLSPNPIFLPKVRGTFSMDLWTTDGAVYYLWQDSQREGDPVPMHAALAALGISTPLPGRSDFLRYYGGDGTIPTVSASDVILHPDKFPAGYFDNRVVFIGTKQYVSSSGGNNDSFAALTDAYRIFGIEIHATAASNLLNRDWIRRLPKNAELFLLTALAYLVAFLIAAFKPRRALLTTLGFCIGWTVLSYVAFLMGQFLPALALCGIVIPTVFLLSMFNELRRLIRSHRDLEEAIGISLPDRVR